MKDDIIDIFKTILAPMFVIVIFIVISVCGIKYVINTYFDNVPTKCFVNNKLVYDGPSCGIHVESSGNTTTVGTHTGFLYMFPKKYYVSNNVVLNGEK